MDKPTITSVKSVFHSRLFDVKEFFLTLPTGKRITYQVVQRRPTVIVFPITEKYELYLINEYRPTSDRYVLKAVTGYIEPDESTLTAAKRELKEETGIEAVQWELLKKVENIGTVTSQSSLFLAKDLEILKAHPQEDESIKLVKMSIADASQKILSGQITVSSTIIGILLLDKLKQEKKL